MQLTKVVGMWRDHEVTGFSEEHPYNVFCELVKSPFMNHDRWVNYFQERRHLPTQETTYLLIINFRGNDLPESTGVYGKFQTNRKIEKLTHVVRLGLDSFSLTPNYIVRQVA